MRILEASQPAKWVDLDSLCRTYHAQDAAIMNDFLGKCVGCPPDVPLTVVQLRCSRLLEFCALASRK